jgi:DTW domain-containing protein
VLPTRTRVVFLQHPRETRVAIGTARMAHLCLPASSLHVGEHFAAHPDLAREISDPDRPAVLLFPAPDAPDILQDPPAGPVTLVVVDGTWSQAKKMVNRSPQLAALPRYAFRPPRASEYRIRREPREDFVSTIEALAHVLGVLEGDPDRMAGLLAPFRAMVGFQVEQATGNPHPRRRSKPGRSPAVPRPPAALAGPADAIVCAEGEANAWPRRAPTSPPQELVYWTALRPATGQRFEAVIRPRHPLFPATVLHSGIPETDLQQGEDWESFAARWAAFLHPGDVLCTWGCHHSGLLGAEGGDLPPDRLDIRQVLKDLSRRHPGRLEELPLPGGGASGEPVGRGRAGRRLALLAAVVAGLCDAARGEPSP